MSDSPAPTKPADEPASPKFDQETYEKRERLYLAYVDDAKKRQVTSQDNYDKSILTYSSGGLAWSLTFMKDFAGKAGPVAHPNWLYASWALFALAIVLTVISFLLSHKVQEESMKEAEDYYLKGIESAWNRETCLDRMLKLSNLLCGCFFMAAVGLTVYFVITTLA